MSQQSLFLGCGTLIVTTFNYLVMAAGLVPAPTGVSVPWTVPIIASGVLATNSWLGGMLQVIDFVIVALSGTHS